MSGGCRRGVHVFIAAVVFLVVLLATATSILSSVGDASTSPSLAAKLAVVVKPRAFSHSISRGSCNRPTRSTLVKSTTGRREALGGLMLATTAGLSLSLPKDAQALNPEIVVESYRDIKPRNIVITGANSGIGRSAARMLAAAGHNVYAVCRTMEKAQATVEELTTSLGENMRGRLFPLACDLADLDSVRKFVTHYKSLNIPLNVLVANAGLSLNANNKDVEAPRTKDGFELTVGTNYLGHFLLVNLLVDELEKAGKDSRIVITGSEVHDPESPGGRVGSLASLGDLSGLENKGAMIDGGKFDPDKAYKDSKLADLMFALELQRRLKAKGCTTTVNSFGPGLITRSGFFRNQDQVFSKLFDFAASDIFRVTETVDFGGACIVYMALSPDLESVGGKWYNAVQPGKPVFEELLPSKEARDEGKAARLFDISSNLVGTMT